MSHHTPTGTASFAIGATAGCVLDGAGAGDRVGLEAVTVLLVDVPELLLPRDVGRAAVVVAMMLFVAVTVGGTP